MKENKGTRAKKVMFSKSLHFMGRNGYYKAIGLEMWKYNEYPELGVQIYPITSKNKLGNCQIEIPLEDIDTFIQILKELK